MSINIPGREIRKGTVLFKLKDNVKTRIKGYKLAIKKLSPEVRVFSNH